VDHWTQRKEGGILTPSLGTRSGDEKRRIPDSTGRTPPNQLDSSALPKVRLHFHHKRVGLNHEKRRYMAGTRHPGLNSQ
jgi:hypothetical protein